MRLCLDVLIVLETNKETLQDAYALGINDFEDAVQIASAVGNGLDGIVTRNANDFAGSPVPVFSPAELVTRLKASP